LYPAIWDKAGCYLESLAKFHVFVDGNKRTAIAAAIRFLYLNGYRFKIENKGLEKFVIKIVVKNIGVPEIAIWLKKHSQKMG
jgi:death on curing protein